MKYFILKEDEKLEYAIKFKDFPTRQKAVFLREDAQNYKDMTNLIVEGESDSIYPDLIQAPVLMVSERLKKIFEMYEDDLIYKTVILTNLELKTQEVYRLVITDVIEALSGKTTYFKNNWEDHIVLDSKKIGEKQIFHLRTSQTTYLVASMDVVESILKRGLVGIEFEEIEVD